MSVTQIPDGCSPCPTHSAAGPPKTPESLGPGLGPSGIGSTWSSTRPHTASFGNDQVKTMRMTTVMSPTASLRPDHLNAQHHVDSRWASPIGLVVRSIAMPVTRALRPGVHRRGRLLGHFYCHWHRWPDAPRIPGHSMGLEYEYIN